MGERDDRTTTARSWDEALEDAMSFYAGDEVLARRSVERKIGPRPLPEDLVGADHGRLRADQALYGVAYVEANGDGTFTRVDPASVRDDNSLPEDVERVRRQLLRDPALNTASVQDESDEQRGRAFLERLRGRREGDWRGAYDALDFVFTPATTAVEPDRGQLAALGRVLRGSA